MDFPTIEVFLKEVFSSFALIRGEGIDFPDFRGKGFIEVNFMVIGSGRWHMVSSFFGEDRSKVGEFRRKGLFGFFFFSSSSKLGGSGDLGDLLFQGGSSVEKVGSASNDSMEGSVDAGTIEELTLFLPSVLLEELEVGDGVDVDVSGVGGVE